MVSDFAEVIAAIGGILGAIGGFMLPEPHLVLHPLPKMLPSKLKGQSAEALCETLSEILKECWLNVSVSKPLPPT